jgi:hypothetical protein
VIWGGYSVLGDITQVYSDAQKRGRGDARLMKSFSALPGRHDPAVSEEAAHHLLSQ